MISVTNPVARNKDLNDAMDYDRFCDLRIAVFTKLDDRSSQLLNDLRKTRAEITHIWPIPQYIPSDFDVVYTELVDNLPTRLEGLPGLPQFTLIIVLSGTDTVDLQLMENCAPHGVIHLPVTLQAVRSSLAVARSHYLYELRLRKRIHQLDENLISVRNIERAKIMLMERMNLNESKAYQHMRRQAMEKRVTISSIAQAIIDAHELFS